MTDDKQIIRNRLDKMPMPPDIIISYDTLHKISSLPSSMNITHNTYPPSIDNHKRQYVEASFQLHDDIAAQQGAAYCSNHSAFQ